MTDTTTVPMTAKERQELLDKTTEERDILRNQVAAQRDDIIRLRTQLASVTPPDHEFAVDEITMLVANEIITKYEARDILKKQGALK